MLHEMKDHVKYAHRAMWSTCGELFATLGHDKCVHIYRVRAAAPAPAEGQVEGEEARGGGGVEVELVRKKELVGIPEAACFLHDSLTLVLNPAPQALKSRP